MEIITIILGLITAHLLGDYVFQSQYIADSKKKDIYHLTVHCWLYTACFWCVLALVNKLSLGVILFIFISHMIIDYSKCKFGHKIGAKAYAIDQILHYVVVFIVFFHII